MAPVAAMFPTFLLLVAMSTASARFIAPELLGEAQREMYDTYGQAVEQELYAQASQPQQIRAQQISSQVQEYEEPLMSEIQGRCENYHGTLVGNVRIAGTSSSRNGCARLIAGKRGLIAIMQICHPYNRRLCYKMGGSGRKCDPRSFFWRDYPIDIPLPGRESKLPAQVNVDDRGICFPIPDFIHPC